MLNPTLVIATRGHHQELSFRGAAAVVDARGGVIRQWGDIKTPIFGRSAFKFIQALPLLESGAADAYHLSPQEITLACASHSGEPLHIQVLERWLNKLGKDERVLGCGPSLPPTNSSCCLINPSSPLCHPCSGKHLSLITTALHRTESTKNYTSRNHPAQKRVEHALSDVTGLDLLHSPFGEDDCGIPAFAIPLFNIAFAMARFANPSQLHYPRQKAIQRLLKVITENPEMMGGTEEFDTKIIHLTKGHVLSKSGENGTEVGIIPSLELGIALKIDDGNRKAAELAFLSILKSLGCLENEEIYEQLSPHSPILTSRGKTVGFYQPTHFANFPFERERQKQ